MYRLIYKSKSIARLNRESIDAITLKSLENNADAAIGGILLCIGDSFLQVLEGPFSDVNRIFMKIARDPRHTDVELIIFHAIDKRMFHQWDIKSIGIFSHDSAELAALKEQYGNDDGELHLPSEEWEALALTNDVRNSKYAAIWRTL